MVHQLSHEEFEAGIRKWNGSAKIDGMGLTDAELEKLRLMHAEGSSIEEMIEAIKVEGGLPPK